MQQRTRCKMAYSAFLAVLVLTGSAAAQDKKPAGKPLDREALDESIHKSLRGIIDHGADLYNQGDWSGCYRLWEGTLMSLKPLLGDRQLRSWTKAAGNDNAVYVDSLKDLQKQLGDRPELKNVIDTALAAAQQTPQIYRRSFILRVVLDQLRAATKPAREVVAQERKPAGTAESKKTLWDRLGGEGGVTKIVDDLVELAAPDPKVDFSRSGKYKPTDEQVAKMKRELVEQISQASGGPLKYKGPDMKSVHKGMGISDAQFNALAADLKKALEKNKVAEEDVKLILDAVGSYRKEIVEPKKGGEKKPAGKASVTGHVTLKGQPLKGGTVIFTNKEGKIEGKIAADGTYKIEGVKPGDYKVSIKGAKGAAVPVKYGDSNTSSLRVSVKDGKNNCDLALQ